MVTHASESDRPAFKQLLDDPKFAVDFREAKKKASLSLEKIKREIMSIPRVRDRLGIVACIQPSEMLHVLAVVAWTSRPGAKNRPAWLDGVERQKEHLKRLSHGLRKVANEAELRYGEEASYLDLWMIARRQKHDGAVVPVTDRVPHELIREMRSHADTLDAWVRDFGRFLKDNSPVASREPVMKLLFYVHGRTKNLSRHLPDLSDMVRAVFERYGIKRRVSAGSLDRLFRRHVKPRVSSPDKTPH